MTLSALSISQIRFLTCVVAAAAGRNMFFVIVAWMVVERTHDPAAVAGLLAAGSIAELLTCNLGGAVVDRFDRRLTCVICDILRILVMAIGTLGLGTPYPLPILVVAWVLYAIIDRTFLTSQQAMVPALIHDECLVQFNSMSYIAMQGGNFLAAIAGGMVLAFIPSEYRMLAPVVCFLLSFLVMRGVDGAFGSMVTSSPKVLSGYREVLPCALPPSPLLVTSLMYALIYAMGMLVNVSGSALAFQELQGSALAFGCIEAFWAIGSISGCLYLLVRKAHGTALVVHLLVSGAVLAVFLIVNSLPLVLLQVTILGISYNVARVLMDVRIQRSVPNHLLGRCRSQVHTICVAVGFTTYGFVAFSGSQLKPSLIFGMFGLAMLSVAIMILTTRGRSPVVNRIA